MFFGTARVQVAGCVFIFLLGLAGLSGAMRPAQVEFVVSTVGFVNDLVEVVGAFLFFVWPVGVSAAVPKVIGGSVCCKDHMG